MLSGETLAGRRRGQSRCGEKFCKRWESQESQVCSNVINPLLTNVIDNGEIKNNQPELPLKSGRDNLFLFSGENEQLRCDIILVLPEFKEINIMH